MQESANYLCNNFGGGHTHISRMRNRGKLCEMFLGGGGEVKILNACSWALPSSQSAADSLEFDILSFFRRASRFVAFQTKLPRFCFCLVHIKNAVAHVVPTRPHQNQSFPSQKIESKVAKWWAQNHSTYAHHLTNYQKKSHLNHFKIFLVSLWPGKTITYIGGWQRVVFQKGGFGGTKTGTRVHSDVPPERKPETRVRSHVPPETKTGTRAHSPKPPFYETALLSPSECESNFFYRGIIVAH